MIHHPDFGYTNKDKVMDAVAGVMLCGFILLFTAMAFGLDVAATGM